jgi:hypothetical protein
MAYLLDGALAGSISGDWSKRSKRKIFRAASDISADKSAQSLITALPARTRAVSSQKVES